MTNDKLKREPLVSVGFIVAFVAAVLQLLFVFGVPLSPDQTQAILALVGLGAPLAVAYFARSKVTPLYDPRDEDGVSLRRRGNDA